MNQGSEIARLSHRRTSSKTDCDAGIGDTRGVMYQLVTLKDGRTAIRVAIDYEVRVRLLAHWQQGKISAADVQAPGAA